LGQSIHQLSRQYNFTLEADLPARDLISNSLDNHFSTFFIQAAALFLHIMCPSSYFPIIKPCGIQRNEYHNQS